jgi:HK97 family phage major capsid protein
MKKRASEEVNALIAKVMADADAIKNKYAESDMPPEDVETLENLVAQLEGLQKEAAEAVASERMAAIKDRMAQPTRPAPRLEPATCKRSANSAGEGLAAWLGSFGPKSDRSPESAYKCRSIGLDIGNPMATIPVRYDGLNRKNRAILSKGGTGTGAELVWQSYSDKVVEYLTYFSPILGMVDSETTSDGNARTYFTIDDTAMESAYTSASSGTETAPTIPDSNLATANKVINVFDITSGYQKISFNELRDSYVGLEAKIAKANSNSHARKLEREIFTATGNGTTGVQGITAAATSAGTPAAWTQDVVFDGLMSIPPQYRKGVIFAANDTTRNEINVALRDDIGRTLFERSIEDDQEFDVLMGHKFLVSQFIADDVLLIFQPEFYKLRMVSGQIFQQFVEKFWPNAAWAGLMSFGGAWVGPTTAAKKLTKT